jgi:cysteine desulfurase
VSTSTPAYLDTAATTRVDPRVAELVMAMMVEDFGNAGSRTHEFGAHASRAVERARAQVAQVVAADPAEVVFTSGATESDNLALLGLAAHGEDNGKTHIVTTAIEHKAVLEPLAELEKRGFCVDYIKPDASGRVTVDDVLSAVRSDTLVVSLMHVNNETGIRQPVAEVADELPDTVFLHTDAAQGFGKDLEPLRHRRIDLISVSGHKVGAPKGVGALIARRRNRRRPPLRPLMYGGGQERGLRPGTVPVPLVAGLGLASELAERENNARTASARALRGEIVEALVRAGGTLVGDETHAMPNILSISFPGLDSEAVILQLRQLVAISNGSACTSSTYEPSHVLVAMGLDERTRRGAVRLSWGHDTAVPDLAAVESAMTKLVPVAQRRSPVE